ncbi:MAG: hypothetical protein Q8K75_12550 [Chlamydiales bacterium]|nr:hypothetical protein [Chlamydiales bacterium]
MVEKLTLARDLQESYKRLTESGQPPLCFVGFDGFTDEIIHVVDQRLDAHTFEPMYTIADFGKRILAAAGKSCNLELVPKETRLGGNAPIMAQALLSGGHRIVFAGAIGPHGNIEPIFQPLALGCERVIPLCPSGHTDALEFYDGKVLLGKIGVLAEVCYEALIARLPEEELIAILDASNLFVSANWTMLPNMNTLWQQLVERIIPHCSQRPENNPRAMWVDLADTAKRSAQDLVEALRILSTFQPAFKAILGLNHSEAQQVYHALIGPPPGPGAQQIEMMAKAIRKHLGIYQVVVHATRFAVAVSEDASARVEGPYCAEPKIITGGGDHFNAGYCNALLFGLPMDACLMTGVATSGFYVRVARSPSVADLANFLEQWHKFGDAFDESASFSS